VTLELKPLIDDPRQPEYVREMVRQARLQTGPRYDLQAGLARHRTLIATGAPLPDWMHPSVGSVFKSGSLITRIIGIASVPVIITGAMWGAGTFSTRPTEANCATAPSANQGAQVAIISTQTDNKVSSSPGANAPEILKPLIISASRDFPAGSASDSQRADTTQKTRPGAVRRTPQSKPYTPLVTARPRPGLFNEQNELAQQGQGLLQNTDGDRTTSTGTAQQTVQLNAVLAQPYARDATRMPVSSPQTPPPIAASAPVASQPSIERLLQQEMALLARARRLVYTDPSTAITLAQGKEPKTGLLSQEWDQVYLLSLVKLGRVEEARQNAQRFRTRYPESAFNERIRKELQGTAQ
jgi:hypothetical protein